LHLKISAPSTNFGWLGDSKTLTGSNGVQHLNSPKGLLGTPVQFLINAII